MLTLPKALSLAEQALASGDHARAEYIYRQILQAAPDEPNALNGLGVLAYRADQLEAAENFHLRAIEVFPGNPAFHNNLNLVYRELGRLSEAADCCRRALELAPDLPELHNNLGIALKENGSLAAAVLSLEHAVQLRPTYAEAYYNLANALVELRRLEEAERAYRRAMELAPSDRATHNNLGLLLQLKGDYSGAIACFEFADAQARCERGHALAKLHQWDEAEDELRRSLELARSDGGTRNDLGVVLQHKGDYSGAMDHFDSALQYQADSAEPHQNRALLRLLHGDFAQGWPEYEWRWKKPGDRPPHDDQPRWEGQSLSGRTILLWCEQGHGDAIQFIRFAPLVRQSGARVLLECPLILHALFGTTAGIDRLVDPDADTEAFDYHLSLVSLPAVLGTTLETVPATIPYLFAEAERVAHWRQKLADVREFKVGIAWQGNPDFAGDYYRSIPLEKFAPLAACPGVRLFSLQKGYGHEQLAPLAEQWNIVDLGLTLDEDTGAFVDTAAVMMNLDLVITSDTSIAHVAGALGVPVWVALQFSPNWRWLLERDDSPWYPTMRLFRQSRFGNWDDVFADMAQQLRSLSSRAPTG